MTEQLSKRVDELESQVAFFEELVQQLNEVVTRQDRDIHQLREGLRDLAGKMSTLRDGVVSGSPADEVPPHY